MLAPSGPRSEPATASEAWSRGVETGEAADAEAGAAVGGAEAATNVSAGASTTCAGAGGAAAAGTFPGARKDGMRVSWIMRGVSILS